MGEGFHTSTKGIKPKVNAMLRQEFELSYFDVAVHHVSYYAGGESLPGVIHWRNFQIQISDHLNSLPNSHSLLW